MLFGPVFLFMRQVSVQFILLALGIWLTRSLETGQFGVYALCTSLAGLLFAVGDLGLGGFILRTGSSVSERQWRTVFSVRLLSDLLVMTVFLISFPGLGSSYGLSEREIYFVQILSILLPIHALGLVPLVKLERELRFGRLAMIEVTQTAVFALFVLTAVRSGNGIIAFPIAWLAHGMTGTIGYQLSSPWFPRFGLDVPWLRGAIGFSIPFQGIGALGLLRDSTIPLVAGALLGAADVGVLNWAQMFALSIGLGCFVMQRAFLPYLARAARAGGVASREEMKRSSEFFVQGIATLIFSLMAVILLYAEPITRLVFHPRWLPALPEFYALSAANLFLPFTIVSAAVLNCLGFSRVVLRASLVSMGVLFLGTCLSVPLLGRWGYILSFLLAQVAAAQMVFYVRKEITWNPARKVGAPIFLICCAVVCLALKLPPSGIDSVLRLFTTLATSVVFVGFLPGLLILTEFRKLHSVQMSTPVQEVSQHVA